MYLTVMLLAWPGRFFGSPVMDVGDSTSIWLVGRAPSQIGLQAIFKQLDDKPSRRVIADSQLGEDPTRQRVIPFRRWGI